MGNAKQCDLKELVTVTQFAQEAENVGDRAIYSRESQTVVNENVGG